MSGRCLTYKLIFNRHVNNKSYINLAEMNAPDEFRKTRSLKNLHIRFNKESFLGDKLICSANKTENPYQYIHIIEKDGVSVCDILTVREEKAGKENIVDYNLAVRNER